MQKTSGLSQSIVIDANVVVWALFPSLTGNIAFDRFMDWHQNNQRLCAPDLWVAEATSGIQRFVYLKMITAEEGKEAIETLFSFSIRTIPLDINLCHKAFEWARRLQQVKIYDSMYLALTEREQAEFWTADKRLVNGAKQKGFEQIHWIQESE